MKLFATALIVIVWIATISLWCHAISVSDVHTADRWALRVCGMFLWTGSSFNLIKMILEGE